MKKLFAKPIREYCDESVSKVLPRFARVPPPAPTDDGSWPAARAYRMTVAPDLHLYILLVFMRHDQFAFEIAWSKSDTPPASDKGVFNSIPESGEVRDFLSFLYANKVEEYDPRLNILELPRGADGKPEREAYLKWLSEDPAPEVFLPRIHSGIDEGMMKICKYAVPYFEKIAAHYGYEIKIECHPVAA